MVELQHRMNGVPALHTYTAGHPQASVLEWESATFQTVKRQVKRALNEDQQGLCAYCERKLSSSEGQIDHIKPKSGPNAHPALCFIYTNYAQSCINNKTCGQKKGHGLLPIEPAPGCNQWWSLSTDGTVEPIAGLTRKQKHEITQTRDMLGLNKDSSLVDDRQKWFNSALEVLRTSPNDLADFLNSSPFRHILATAL